MQDSNMIDLTIIIPTKDRLWALPQALESCRQEGVSIQLIVVDDGSKDGTWEWLARQSAVETLRLEGWGKPFAVNRAFQLAKGEFLRFLDSDDWFPESTLWEQVSIARRERADLVVAGYNEVDKQGRLIRQVAWTECDDFVSQQLGECNASHYSAFTFRTAFIRDIPHRSNFAAPVFATRDDRCFILEVALKCPRIAVAKLIGLCHRHHDCSRLQRVSGFSADAANLNTLLVYRKILSLLETNGQLTERRRRAAGPILAQVAEWLSDRELLTSLMLAEVSEMLGGHANMPPGNSREKLRKIVGNNNYFKIRSIRRTFLDLFARRQSLGSSVFENWLR